MGQKEGFSEQREKEKESEQENDETESLQEKDKDTEKKKRERGEMRKARNGENVLPVPPGALFLLSVASSLYMSVL